MAELARQVVDVVEGAVARDAPIAHRPQVDPLDLHRAAGGREPGRVQRPAHPAAHPPAPRDLIALRGAMRRVRLVEAQVGEAHPAAAHEVLDGGDAARRARERRVLPHDVLRDELGHGARVVVVPGGEIARAEGVEVEGGGCG